MHRVSIGTWAYSVGPYANNPVPFGEVVKGLKAMGLPANMEIFHK